MGAIKTSYLPALIVCASGCLLAKAARGVRKSDAPQVVQNSYLDV
jgi:hypothetical protein